MNEITRTGWDVLDEARAMLRAAVAGAPADGWQRLTPCTELECRPGAAARSARPGGVGGGHSGTQPSGENRSPRRGSRAGAAGPMTRARSDASRQPAWGA